MSVMWLCNTITVYRTITPTINTLQQQYTLSPLSLLTLTALSLPLGPQSLRPAALCAPHLPSLLFSPMFPSTARSMVSARVARLVWCVACCALPIGIPLRAQTSAPLYVLNCNPATDCDGQYQLGVLNTTSGELSQTAAVEYKSVSMEERPQHVVDRPATATLPASLVTADVYYRQYRFRRFAMNGSSLADTPMLPSYYMPACMVRDEALGVMYALQFNRWQ